MPNAILKISLAIALCVISIEPVRADIAWLNIVSQNISTLHIIAISPIIKAVFIKKYMNLNWRKSFLVGITVNAISVILGVLLICLGQILLVFIAYVVTMLPLSNQALTYLSYWGAYIFCITLNVLLECTAICIWFDKEFKHVYRWLTYANILSVSLVFAYLIFIEGV